MRQSRFKPKGIDSYYHLVNHVGGPKGQIPFDSEDKMRGVSTLKRLIEYYCLELISYCWMGNHFHLIVFSPGTPPPLEEAANRFNKYKGYSSQSAQYLTPEKNKSRCKEIALNLVDISHFMKTLQQTFSIYYNNKYDHHGSLWKSRFWSTFLEGKSALWECVKYIAMNPVRAKICFRPDEYLYSSWGRYKQTGHHPCREAFKHHMSLNNQTICSDTEPVKLSESVFSLFETQLTSVFVRDSKLLFSLLLADKDLSHKWTKTLPKKYRSKLKSWTRNVILGSKSFINQYISEDIQAKLSINPDPGKELSHGVNSNGTKIFSISSTCLASP